MIEKRSSEAKRYFRSHTLVEAAIRIPLGVICLLSALRLHKLTTQSPHEVWMASGIKACKPKTDWPPLRIVRFSGTALSFVGAR